MKKRKKGRSLELLVSHLEKALGVDATAEVESPKHLPDRITGRMREHDVVVTLRQAHHEVLVAIECRDRSRPVSTPQVEAFHKKCEDTGVHRAVIVSSKGFYKPAAKKAQYHGIRCLDIEEATSHEWLAATGLRLSQRRSVNLSTVVVSTEPLEENGDYIIAGYEADEIHEVSPESLQSALLEASKYLPWDSRDGREQVSEFKIAARELYAFNKRTGSCAPIDYMHCKLSLEVMEQLVPFRLVNYRDHVSGEGITEAAIAEVKAGKIAGRVVVVYKQGEGGNVVFVRTEPKMEKECS